MENRIYEPMKIDNLKDMLKKSGKLYGDRPAFKYKTDKPGEFRIITHKEFRKDIDYLGTALINLGLKYKRIAVISENRYEWCTAYLAIACGTGIVVPLDKSLPENEIKSLIERSNVEAIFYSRKYDTIMQKIKDKEIGKLKYFISMDLEESENGIYSQRELIKKGKSLLINGNTKFLDAEIDSENMGMMLFTSGTTAVSKVVALSHKNICTNMMDISSVINITENDVILSFLPLHHAFECTVGFLHMIYKGACIAFCDGIRHIADNIREYQITAMISVPILFESMYRKVMRNIEKKGKLKTVERGIKASNALLKIHIDARKKIFKEIHETLGGKVRLFVSGAAGLDPVVEKGFNDLGFKIVQGYGLTETSPVIAAGNDVYFKNGSVGKVFPSLEVKIDNPNEEGVGEIIVKGPSVMLEYYGNEEATRESLRDGWFYTGDLGYFDSEKFLYVTGRKKNVIVLKNGKNIYPEELENLVNRIEGVKECIVYGKPDTDNDTKICVKIVYNEMIVKEVYGIEAEEDIYKIMLQKVKEVNKKVPTYKYIREVSVTKEELIKTTTAKVKRHEELAKIFGTSNN